MPDLHLLPKVRDSWSFLYLEHGRIERDDKAIAFHSERGCVAVPCASLMLLMLGPGTSITHAAIRSLADSGCLVAWTGEDGVRFYSQGSGGTHSSARLAVQARCWADPIVHLATVRRLYGLRFSEPLSPDLTLEQIRGKEGVRVREAYAAASRISGVQWSGRSYVRGEWRAADPINRALSTANSCLYGICHAAILAAGYSPALGFIHSGKMLSFVYDVADLYKTATTIPAAFSAVAQGIENLETRVRRNLRDEFSRTRVLRKVVDDLGRIFADQATATPLGDDPSVPGALWDPTGGVSGGVNWSSSPEQGDDDGGDHS